MAKELTEEEEFMAQWFAQNQGETKTEEDSEEAEVETAAEAIVEAPEMSEEDAFVSQYVASESFQRPTRATVQAGRDKRNVPGAGTRAIDALQLGLSDAMSTLAGDDVTSSGDPRDLPMTAFPLSMGEEGIEFNPVQQNRLLRAASQVVGGGGAAAGEIIGAADEALGGPLQTLGETYTETKASHPIYSEAGIEPVLEDMREVLGDEPVEVLEDTVRVGGAILPYSPRLRSTRFSRKVDDLPDAAKRQRREQIEERWKPKAVFDDPDLEVTYSGGVVDRQIATPKEGSFRARMYDDLEAIDDLNPREAPGKTFNRIDAEADRLRRELDSNVKMNQTELNMDDVSARLDTITEKGRVNPNLADPAAQSAYDRTLAQFENILNSPANKYTDGDIVQPYALLQARRDLDTYLRNNKQQMLDPNTHNGASLAIKELRQEINKLINENVKDVDVAESLRKQHSLLSARDEIRDLANREAGNRFTRALQETQEQTGLALPHSPAAIGANLQPGALMAGTGLLAYNRGRHGARRAGRNVAAYSGALGEGTYNVGRGAIVPMAMSDEEERQRRLSEYIRRPQ